MRQRLRFFPDYGGADPVWTVDGVGVDVDTLPLRAETTAAVRDWCARWEPLARRLLADEGFTARMPGLAADPPSRESWRRIGEKGQRLCALVQLELGEREVPYEGPC